MHAFKSFNNFEDLVKEIRSISPAIEAVLCDEDGNPPCKNDEAILMLINHIQKDIPSIFNINYPSCPAFSVSEYEVGYRFPGQLAFGWKIALLDDGNIVYKARITLSANSVIAEKSSVIQTCKELGWEIREKSFKDTQNQDNHGGNNNFKQKNKK